MKKQTVSITKEDLDFKITSLMADLLTESDEVKIFWTLKKMRDDLKEIK